MYAIGLAARLSWRDFLVVYPPRVYLSTTLPRAVLQVSFFAFVGYYAAGAAGREFAFIGACTHVIVLATVVRAPDVLIDERVMGTLYRLRLGIVPLPAIAFARWCVYLCAGIMDGIVAWIVASALVGHLELLPELARIVPLFLLIAVTTSGVGLLVAAASLTQRIDIVLTNVASYMMLVFCGVVAPLSAFGTFGEQLVRLLPLSNGLLAVRAVVGHEPWLAHAGRELAVGTAWIFVAAVVLQLQSQRARRRGTDDLL